MVCKPSWRVHSACAPEHWLRVRGPQHLGAVEWRTLEHGHVHLHPLDADRVFRPEHRHGEQPLLPRCGRGVRLRRLLCARLRPTGALLRRLSVCLPHRLLGMLLPVKLQLHYLYISILLP